MYTFREKFKSKSNVFSHKGTRKRRAGETIDFQLLESMNKVSDAVKTIVGLSVAPGQNDEIDTDMHFCKSLVSSLKVISPNKNRLARVKIQKVLFEIEFEENID